MSEENNVTDARATASIDPEAGPPTVPATIQWLLKLHRRQTIATYIAATAFLGLYLFTFIYSSSYGWDSISGGFSSFFMLSFVTPAIYAGLAWHEKKQKLGEPVTDDELTWARKVIENYTPEFREMFRSHAAEVGGVNRDLIAGLAKYYRRKYFANAFGHVRPASDPAVKQLLEVADRPEMAPDR